MIEEIYKQQILDKGYTVVAETEDGISFVNVEVQTCAMLLFNYDDSDTSTDKDIGIDLHKTLTTKYIYANKGTICVIANTTNDRNTILRNQYFFTKISPEHIFILPSKIDKSITITIKPMIDINDLGDHTVNPFEPIDGLTCIGLYRFLSIVTKDSTIKYPPCIEPGYFRYITNKFFSIN